MPAGLITAGMTSLFGGLVNTIVGAQSQALNRESQESINAANIAQAERWNSANYDLAVRAQNAQEAQQAFANEQYVDAVDYEKAVQQQTWQREDTAIQRAVMDAQAAGFSPLAALGMPANAGQVVSTSSAPGNMVSNNQASVSNPHLQAYNGQALTGIGDAFGSIGNMIATYAEQQSAQEHEADMKAAEFVARLKEIDSQGNWDKILNELEYDFLIDQENRKHTLKLAENLQQLDIQEKLAAVTHDYDMARQDDAQQHEMDMAQQQRQWQQDNASNQRGLHDVIGDLIPLLADGDSRLEKWLRKNTNVIKLIIEGGEILAPSVGY